VKLAPANQTFIPAGDPGRQGRALISALRTVADGSVLKRVTIVAANPDEDVMVLQADYAPESARSSVPRGSAYLSPIEQYARTQQNTEAVPRPRLDVRA
jgi:hypothetical protein